MQGYTVQPIKREDAIPWIMKKHYAKRMPNIKYSFGLFRDKIIIGIATFGIPASNNLCVGVCGKEHKDIVIEFNRLCLQNNLGNEGSFLISRSLKLIPRPAIVVSYADTAQGHIGIVYQATNWIYTGLNNEVGRKNPRKHRISVNNPKLHSRHLSVENTILVEIPLKHRYIYFLGSKKQKKEMRKSLNYPVLPYPKGESKRYDASAEFPRQVQLY